MSEIAQTDNFNDKTIIKVVGVGGAGGNAVNRMISEGLQNVEFVAINTDAKDLLRSDADVKISLSDASRTFSVYCFMGHRLHHSWKRSKSPPLLKNAYS